MSVMNLRGKCRCPHPKRWAGTAGCWLKKGHKGNHSAWIYEWKRTSNDSRETKKHLKWLKSIKRDVFS